MASLWKPSNDVGPVGLATDWTWLKSIVKVIGSLIAITVGSSTAVALTVKLYVPLVAKLLHEIKPLLTLNQLGALSKAQVTSCLASAGVIVALKADVAAPALLAYPDNVVWPSDKVIEVGSSYFTLTTNGVSVTFFAPVLSISPTLVATKMMLYVPISSLVVAVQAISPVTGSHVNQVGNVVVPTPSFKLQTTPWSAVDGSTVAVGVTGVVEGFVWITSISEIGSTVKLVT